jgi:cytochrome c-type biogenesis protein CcmH
MKTRLSRLAALGLGAILMTAGASSDPAERLADPAKEARARALFKEVRCLVCQNESIDDSEADLAGDLRKVVRGKVASGATDAEVRSFLVDRYGKFVLLKPPLDPSTVVLWLLPFAAAAGGAAFLLLRKRSAAPAAEEAAPLSEAEKERLKSLGL